MKGVRTIAKNNVGNVYRGNTKYIDKDTKPQRNFVVVKDNGRSVAVAKLKSIKNADDKALMRIDKHKYNLEKETGIDFQRFSKNRMSNKDLTLTDKKVFPEDKPRFKLSSKDTHRAVIHTTPKKKRGK